MNYSSNGRVNLQQVNNVPFAIFQENPSTSFLPFKKQAITHINTRNQLSDLFFSEENQLEIQNQLRYQVWVRTEKQYVIDKQSPSELQLIMRSIYFQHAKNLDYDYRSQIRELNDKVLDYAVDKVVSNLLQYLRYKKDISTLPTPMEYPEKSCMKGTKTLIMPNYF